MQFLCADSECGGEDADALVEAEELEELESRDAHYQADLIAEQFIEEDGFLELDVAGALRFWNWNLVNGYGVSELFTKLTMVMEDNMKDLINDFGISELFKNLFDNRKER